MTSGQSKWRATATQDRAWRPESGLSASARAAEQDRAASGRTARMIEMPDGRTVTASIELKVPKGRRVYAYLRFTVDSKTHNRYVGEVDQDTREANLAQAWCIAREKSLLEWSIAGSP